MSIANMNFKERSLLFAKLAKISYYTEWGKYLDKDPYSALSI